MNITVDKAKPPSVGELDRSAVPVGCGDPGAHEPAKLGSNMVEETSNPEEPAPRRESHPSGGVHTSTENHADSETARCHDEAQRRGKRAGHVCAPQNNLEAKRCKPDYNHEVMVHPALCGTGEKCQTHTAGEREADLIPGNAGALEDRKAVIRDEAGHPQRTPQT